MKGKFRKEILNGQLRRKMDEPMEIWKRLENSFGMLGCIAKYPEWEFLFTRAKRAKSGLQ